MFTGWLLSIPLFAMAIQSESPVVVVDRDNIEITRSCRVEIKGDHIIDADGNGVVHIKGEGITVDFNQQRLHGAPPQLTPDRFSGFGVKIAAKNVTIHNLNVSGFKVGIHAINADGLTIHDCDVSNNFHQRLRSTPQAEDASDWLWPHANDNNEWMNNYGAGICVEDSKNVTLRNIRARKTQNGIILDRVNDSKVYDNDCSFLSGWGLAMWRSNKNIISRNAFDFCVRGYSHGVYNRGQDSAGILMFEQCSENIIAENSATHGGDGFFGFAGKDALGEVNPREDIEWYKRRGNNNNIIYGNKFSYAAAHGLELTFSFGNLISRNLIGDNAICGIWGGYSQDTVIHENIFLKNGDAGYGKERGGINIEHGRGNVVYDNVFSGNACGIFLWWDDDRQLLASTWAKVNNPISDSNVIAQCKFLKNSSQIVLEHTSNTFLAGNRSSTSQDKYMKDGQSLEADEPSRASVHDQLPEQFIIPQSISLELPGKNKGGGIESRRKLVGRENIIMTEWGPWDHESPLLRFERTFDHADEYRLLKAKLPNADDVQVQGNVLLDLDNSDNRIIVRPKQTDAVQPYVIAFEADGIALTAIGTLTGGSWEVWTFASACDPREDVERWRREATANHQTSSANAINFKFGNSGMSEAVGLPVQLPHNHFGVIATRKLSVPGGKWKVKTTSDDGIRVWMNDRLIIDDWTHHGPTKHDYEFTLDEATAIDWRVEYFELDGYAVLDVAIVAAD